MNQVQQSNNNVKSFFEMPAVRKKFDEVMGSNSKSFITSLLNVTSQNKLLANADPKSIMQSAMVAATLDLPIEPSLGFAYIVPYKQEAQFQLGYKGLIQLALRSGQVTGLNSGQIYAEQFVSFNPLSEALEIDPDAIPDESKNPVGYFAYMKLSNGFEKTIYWSYEKVHAHGKKYSKSFGYNSSPWKSDFDAMAQKTVLKKMLSTYAPLNTEMQQAIVADNEESTVERGDVTPETASAAPALADLAAQRQTELLTEPEPQPEAKPEQEPVETVPDAGMTVTEMKQYLSSAGVSYPAGARKQEPAAMMEQLEAHAAQASVANDQSLEDAFPPEFGDK